MDGFNHAGEYIKRAASGRVPARSSFRTLRAARCNNDNTDGMNTRHCIPVVYLSSISSSTNADYPLATATSLASFLVRCLVTIISFGL
jgi:hypothetical protein